MSNEHEPSTEGMHQKAETPLLRQNEEESSFSYAHIREYAKKQTNVSVQSSMHTTVTNENVTVDYAGFWLRFVARWIDTTIVSGFLVFLASFLFGIFYFVLLFSGALDRDFGSESEAMILSMITSIGILLVFFILFIVYLIVRKVYDIFLIYRFGRTFGKMMMCIAVVDARDGTGRLTLGRTIVRETIGKLLSSILFSIGYLVTAITAQKQALHDYVSSTVVIKSPFIRS